MSWGGAKEAFQSSNSSWAETGGRVQIRLQNFFCSFDSHVIPLAEQLFPRRIFALLVRITKGLYGF